MSKTAQEKRQRKNRLHLADMLENRVKDSQFNMATFSSDCGTMGCALGIAVMSGEFGYGWNTEDGFFGCKIPRPVKNGQFDEWENVGPELFGDFTMNTVFWNTNPRTRQQVAQELRDI